MRGAREAAREDEGVIQQPIHRRAAFADCHKVSFETSCQQQNPPRLDARAFLKPAGHLFLSITAQHPEDADVIQQHIHRWMGLNGKTGLTRSQNRNHRQVLTFVKSFSPATKSEWLLQVLFNLVAGETRSRNAQLLVEALLAENPLNRVAANPLSNR